MSFNKKFSIGFSLLLMVVVFCSWGSLVHKTVHQLAIYQLPNELQGFFYNHADYLIKNSTRPDNRKNEDKEEETKHFIDFEEFGEDAANKMPRNWDAAQAVYTADTLKKYGYVPYVIIAMQQKLTHAFKEGLKDSILFYAADLGHYIGDAHVPLHTTNNYDGQLSNQKGIHALWESMIPEIEIENFNLYTNHKARYIKNKEEAVWLTLRKSYKMLATVFAKETEVSKSFTDATKYRVQLRRGKEVKYYTSDFAKAYYAALENTINEQLLLSSNMIADFWFTAWVDAGKPNLNKIFNEEISIQTNEAIKAELNSFKNNTLLNDKLLKAKNKVSGEQ